MQELIISNKEAEDIYSHMNKSNKEYVNELIFFRFNLIEAVRIVTSKQ